MAPVHRVAVIQWHIKALAMDENHQKACTYIREAASQGAHLAVLPEYHLNAFPPTNPLYLPQTSPQITTKYLQSYQTLAKELNICIVPGTIVEDHSPTNESTSTDTQPKDPILYNTAYFISNDGSILSSYRKKNIWHPERPYLTSSGSDPHEVFDTPIGKVGLLICWDLAFPEAFRELIAAGAEVVVVPTFCMFPFSPPCLSLGLYLGLWGCFAVDVYWVGSYNIDRDSIRRLTCAPGEESRLREAVSRVRAYNSVF
ncbi:carbon-nitrogen hydrolase [Aspergillus arachidicola]|uniref:Carbon-nitrogen hydrolase n=1 Tax=Aspergillus arachidicola TaxID=656916 RepID=A0A5N6YRI9_9EURO|nr:carbon-nitrogen hydrolase [Aspergillus arachidicola]